ncbi:hypothetical protein TNCV_2628691 [Trichonephila clavipes]|uniref:Uncharacterized protein n=1 Tax=Trichonephila clavipes TaxID=2585209 RepID=A0A8X6VL45_TRICX|nr:hypothetical protein TNCV_2628691 [Trichonephila clavipes]
MLLPNVLPCIKCSRYGTRDIKEISCLISPGVQREKRQPLGHDRCHLPHFLLSLRVRWRTSLPTPNKWPFCMRARLIRKIIEYQRCFIQTFLSEDSRAEGDSLLRRLRSHLHSRHQIKGWALE